jgi:hypothetical protein
MSVITGSSLAETGTGPFEIILEHIMRPLNNVHISLDILYLLLVVFHMCIKNPISLCKGLLHLLEISEKGD